MVIYGKYSIMVEVVFLQCPVSSYWYIWWGSCAFWSAWYETLFFKKGNVQSISFQKILSLLFPPNWNLNDTNSEEPEWFLWFCTMCWNCNFKFSKIICEHWNYCSDDACFCQFCYWSFLKLKNKTKWKII